MAESKKICRLCLNAEDDNYSQLDASAIGKIKAVVEELVLSFPSKDFMCSKCRDALENSFNLKRNISKYNDMIQNVKDKPNFNLNNFVSGGVAGPNDKICRICFQTHEGKYSVVSKENDDDDLYNVLTYCVPELELHLSTNPSVCSVCVDSVREMYKLKRSCLAAEEKIQTFYGSSSPQNVDLKKVIGLSAAEEENDFLSAFEVQDEEGTDIFDNIPDGEGNRKRAASDNIQDDKDDVKTKRQKLMTGEITDEELPPFQFTVNFLYNPLPTDITVEDWLTRVEEYKQKFNWSDYTTIHKVLVRLKDMNELYIWFSNIADIMNWEQWKKKLLRAFPRKNDFAVHMRKMIVRRKKKDETYVNYYNSKMALMESLSLTDEEKISCIFGGISDVLVSCVGRVGDYQNPEELLDYFKSCDDKQSVEAAAQVTKPAAQSQKSGSNRQNQQSSSPKKQNLLADKKIKLRCFECKRNGHTALECREYRIGAHLDRMSMLKQQNNPKPSQARARRVRKNSKVKCAKCLNVGHATQSCPLLKGPGSQKQSPSKGKEGAKCTVCSRIGHSASECLRKSAKKPQRPKAASPRSQRPQGRPEDDPWSRCRDCGRFGSKLNPCCSARLSHNGSNLGAYQAEDEFNRQICLRCYQTGHLTKDCVEYSRRYHRT